MTANEPFRIVAVDVTGGGVVAICYFGKRSDLAQESAFLSTLRFR